MKVTQHTEELKGILDRIEKQADSDDIHLALIELDTINLLLKDLTCVLLTHLSSQASHMGCEI